LTDSGPACKYIEEKSGSRIKEAIPYFMEEKQEKEFTIHDRRTSASQEASEARKETPKEQPGSAEQKPIDSARTQEQKGAGTLPELDFSALVISLATTAQVSMGNIPNPQTNKLSKTCRPPSR
jgi:hypothetical protein